MNKKGEESHTEVWEEIIFMVLIALAFVLVFIYILKPILAK